MASGGCYSLGGTIKGDIEDCGFICRPGRSGGELGSGHNDRHRFSFPDTVNLYTGEKRGGGKLEYNSLSDDGKKLSMEPVEFKAKDIEDGKADLGQALLRAIEEKVAEDSD